MFGAYQPPPGVGIVALKALHASQRPVQKGPWGFYLPWHALSENSCLERHLEKSYVARTLHTVDLHVALHVHYVGLARMLRLVANNVITDIQ